MRIFRTAMLAAGFAALAAPAWAQAPHLNMMPELQSKTPEEKEADEARERAYKDTLRKIPDAKTSSDPWGGVRTTTEAPKTPAVKTTATKKPKATANTN